MNLERISAVTLKVGAMARSVDFYKDILGLDILYGGKNACFSLLRPAGAKDVILNLEKARRLRAGAGSFSM
jgi:catechol 2,3-dioxygenase-like lactoylglutathione lyase family enzyme